MQSSELCCAMVIANALDSKHLYQDFFKGFYQWGEKLRTEGLEASAGFGPKLKPFKLTHNVDMKAAWYLSGKGGGCKTKTYFCHLCSCTKESLVRYTIGHLRCEQCKG